MRTLPIDVIASTTQAHLPGAAGWRASGSPELMLQLLPVWSSQYGSTRTCGGVVVSSVSSSSIQYTTTTYFYISIKHSIT